MMKRLKKPLHQQLGAAILMAMLVVALVASLASAAIWQQWRSVAIETAEHEQHQGMWLLVGALDFVRLIFREDTNSDMRNGARVDSLDENWALFIKESKLSTFLAMDKNSNADLDLPVYLSGYSEDAQAKLNLRNLWDNTTPEDITAYQRLFVALQLSESDLTGLRESLSRIFLINPIFTSNNPPPAGGNPVAPNNPAQGGGTPNNPAQGGGTPNNPTLAPAAPRGTPIYFEPLMMDDLLALGIAQTTIDKLKPHVSILPARTAVNINTATAEVLYAVGMDQGAASAWLKSRKTQPIKKVEEIAKLGKLQNVDIKSDYFWVNGRIRIDQLLVQEQSLIKRVDSRTEIVSRRRVPPIIEP